MPKTSTAKQIDDRIKALNSSPINALKAKEEREVDHSLIDKDLTNPGGDEFSKRYERRAPDIRESFDIIGSIVYPLVICEKQGDAGRYLIVDGHGRRDEARRRGVKKMRAIIFPPLSLEQRICLREVLNAAQEPFDTPLVLRDLHLLARERGLEIRNAHDFQSLLADLPARIRKHEDKLKILAKWPAEVADRIGVDDDDNAGVIGFDKVKELNTLVNGVQRSHPDSAKAFPGDKLYKQVLKLYFDGRFRDGRRSQDTIRDARSLLKKLPENHAAAKKFISGALEFNQFKAEAERHIPERSAKNGLVEICRELTALLTDADARNLTAVERRALKRTAVLTAQVLSEEDAN
jgi:hypothetical protein